MVEDGQVEIEVDLSAVTGTYDGRSHVKITLDAIEATIVGMGLNRVKPFEPESRIIEYCMRPQLENE